MLSSLSIVDLSVQVLQASIISGLDHLGPRHPVRSCESNLYISICSSGKLPALTSIAKSGLHVHHKASEAINPIAVFADCSAISSLEGGS